LAKFAYVGLILGVTAPAAPKNDAVFKSGQN